MKKNAIKKCVLCAALPLLLGRSLAGCAASEAPVAVTPLPAPVETAVPFTPLIELIAPTPDAVPGQAPGQSPAETPTEAPGQSPGQAPGQSPAETPAQTAAEQTPEPDPEKTVVAEGFCFYPLTEGIKARINGTSYPEGATIGYDELRYIELVYYDFEGNTHAGELIVNRALAKEVTEIFYQLYQAKYPFTSIRLVDDFGEPGDDNLSMEANNTSAFNYRKVSGTNTMSLHSYGCAIDINPLYNPYVKGERVSPPGGAPYVDRSLDFPGKIDKEDLCYQLFTSYGWSWGGDFNSSKDYQHFSKKVG